MKMLMDNNLKMLLLSIFSNLLLLHHHTTCLLGVKDINLANALGSKYLRVSLTNSDQGWEVRMTAEKFLNPPLPNHRG